MPPVWRDSNEGHFSRIPAELQLKAGADSMIRNWTLNDEINHHKHGFIPINQPQLRMNLSYQKSASLGNTVSVVASFPLDLPDLLKKDLIRVDEKGGKKGFRLRFVHDPADHGIYIQRNELSPRQFVASIPPNAR
jgi:hypothetical protein